jgi:hypothetical protein
MSPLKRDLRGGPFLVAKGSNSSSSRGPGSVKLGDRNSRPEEEEEWARGALKR